jgi:hypothetical protein
MFSPNFFEKIDHFKEKGLPMDPESRRYKRVLRQRLFNALNNDLSEPTDALVTAKNDIHKILHGKFVYTEEDISTDEFLRIMQDAGVQGALLEALTDYQVINPITFRTQKAEGPYMGPCGSDDAQKNNKFRDNARAIFKKLNTQGLITDEELGEMLTKQMERRVN